jgi:3-phenylpropionate/trans-cinnamate dioxygenase ferredoxin reductase subunit
MSRLVVIGASYAGIQAALAAREAGYLEPITVLTDEDCLPYERPPLSKDFLTGETSEQKLILRDHAFFERSRIELRIGQRAIEIDRRARRVALAGNGLLGFDKLLIAAGSRARRLSVPGVKLDGVCYLRSVADAVSLRARLAQSAEIVVIGGGFIGLEVASSAAKLGKKVTIIESASRVLGRAISPVVSRFLVETHVAAGIEVKLKATVSSLEGRHGRIAKVRLADGLRLAADLVVVGIGGIANDELAKAAGIKCSDGIVVDEHGRTEAPEIYAAGDCARHFSRHADGWIRLESVQNAQDQARAAGLAIAGSHVPYESVPRFWSDQHDVRLQIVGLSARHDSLAIRGSPQDKQFSVFYYREGKLLAADSVNRPGDQMVARRLIAARISPTPEQAADASFDLKSLLKAIERTKAEV